MKSWQLRSSIGCCTIATIVNIRGNSYRMREHTELWRALNQESSEGSSQSRSSKKAKDVRVS